MIRIPFPELKATIEKAFVRAGMPEARADTCARVHTETTCDGVNSHGINRVERFVEYIHSGLVDVHATPVLSLDLGAMEIYDGNLGPGILNALFAMDRATALAKEIWLGDGEPKEYHALDARRYLRLDGGRQGIYWDMLD
jgi:3-dehydro-L-gulonate 2-dehydrogenase